MCVFFLCLKSVSLGWVDVDKQRVFYLGNRRCWTQAMRGMLSRLRWSSTTVTALVPVPDQTRRLPDVLWLKIFGFLRSRTLHAGLAVCSREFTDLVNRHRPWATTVDVYSHQAGVLVLALRGRGDSCARLTVRGRTRRRFRWLLSKSTEFLRCMWSHGMVWPRHWESAFFPRWKIPPQIHTWVPRLRTLHLHHLTLVSLETERLCMEGLPMLQDLRVVDCLVSPSWWDVVEFLSQGQLRSMTAVRLKQVYKDSEERPFVTFLGRGPGLVLTLRACVWEVEPPRWIQSDAMMDIVASLAPHLVELHLLDMRRLELLDLSIHLPRLRVMDISDTAINAILIVSHCPWFFPALRRLVFFRSRFSRRWMNSDAPRHLAETGRESVLTEVFCGYRSISPQLACVPPKSHLTQRLKRLGISAPGGTGWGWADAAAGHRLLCLHDQVRLQPRYPHTSTLPFLADVWALDLSSASLLVWEDLSDLLGLFLPALRMLLLDNVNLVDMGPSAPTMVGRFAVRNQLDVLSVGWRSPSLVGLPLVGLLAPLRFSAVCIRVTEIDQKSLSDVECIGAGFRLVQEYGDPCIWTTHAELASPSPLAGVWLLPATRTGSTREKLSVDMSHSLFVATRR